VKDGRAAFEGRAELSVSLWQDVITKRFESKHLQVELYDKKDKKRRAKGLIDLAPLAGARVLNQMPDSRFLLDGGRSELERKEKEKERERLQQVRLSHIKFDAKAAAAVRALSTPRETR
jgi:hypothetical protein